MANDDDRVTLAVLKAELGHLREHFDEQVKNLKSYIGLQFEGHEAVQLQRDKAVDERLVLHDRQISALQKREHWRWVGQAITAVASVIGIRTGWTD